MSLETGAVLARQRLLVEAQEDPAARLGCSKTRLQSQTEPDGAMALAELSYHVGVDRQTKSPVAAMAWYRDAAILAALALGDPATSRPDLAVDIHNRAVARLIRVAQTRLAREGGNRSWRAGSRGAGARGSQLDHVSRARADRRPARGERSRVEGMDHVYRSSGLGVPLIAHRFTDESRDARRPGPVLPS